MTIPCEQAQTIAQIKDDTERLNHAVFGNGDPGIRANLLLVAQLQQVHGDRVGRIEKFLYWLGGGIGLCLVAAFMNLILKK